MVKVSKVIEDKIALQLPEVVSTGDVEVQRAAVYLIKEACRRVGMGLEDYLKAIKGGLSATRVTVDKYGDEHYEDNHEVRLKAAAMGLEVEGYLKGKGGSSDGIINNFIDVKAIIQRFEGIKSSRVMDGKDKSR